MNLAGFLESLKGKNIHLVGVSGSEGSSIFNLLVNNGLSRRLTVHDFIEKKGIEKNFRLFHKGIPPTQKSILFQKFSRNLEKVEFHDNDQYLKGIDKADIIFVPQSWRLYRENSALLELSPKIPFYSLLRIYLDFAPAKIIAVSGTVGKGSVANLIFQLLVINGKSAYFAGNESWRLQLAENLADMKNNDYLVLEISHRQLQDGFSRAPFLTVITNIYPNHLDEVSFSLYQKLKLTLVQKQTREDIAILNYDDEILRNAAGSLNSKIVYYSAKNKLMNSKNIQSIFDAIMNIKSDQYPENILAASSAALIADIPVGEILPAVDRIRKLPARLELIAEIKGIKIYDDIKSTTPWASLRAVEFFKGNIILICGGNTKNIDYQIFVKELNKRHVKLIMVKSELTEKLSEQSVNYKKWEVTDMSEAVKKAFQLADRGDKILVSPAAANFYSRFIKGKKSLRNIIKEIEP